MTQIKEVIQKLETFAPPVLQENYDNAGLIVGDANEKVKGILISLDTTEDVVNEAIKKGCNLIISHHPIIFSGLKKLTGASYIERVYLSAYNLGNVIIHLTPPRLAANTHTLDIRCCL